MYISHIWRIRSMKHVSIFHRRTSVFLAEQLKEKAGILISDGKADIICGKCGAPKLSLCLHTPAYRNHLQRAGPDTPALSGGKIVKEHRTFHK